MIPYGEHWAIIETITITVPGDLRSIQSPGHGYPEHQEQTISYTAFTSREAFYTAFKSAAANSYRKVRGIHVTETFSASVVPVVDIKADDNNRT